MNKFLNELIELSKSLNLEKFYDIDINEYEIKLQGFYKSDLVKDLIEKGFPELVIEQETGYAKTQKGVFKIILT